MFQLAADCLMELDRYYFFEAVTYVIEDVQDLIDATDQPKLEAWTGACIGVVINYQNLESEQHLFPLKMAEVAAYFSAPEKNISDLRLQCLAELSKSENRAMYFSVHFEYLEERMEEFQMQENWELEWIEHHFSKPISEVQGAYLKKLLNDQLQRLSASETSSDVAEISTFSIEAEKLYIEVEGYEFDRFFLSEILTELGFAWKDGDLLLIEENQYAPTEHYSMFMEQFELMNLEGLEVDSEEDLNEQLQERFMGKTPDELRRENPPSPAAAAMLGALRAFRKSKHRSIKEARSILEEVPDCVEAHICLAGWEEDGSRRIDQLLNAVSSAENSLDIDEIETNGLWWIDHRTRPYLRALLFLGVEYVHAKEFVLGEEILMDLLEMDPEDHQSVRYFILEYGLVQKKWLLLRKIFNLFPEDDSILFYYIKFMYLYHTIGRKSKTKRALVKAFDRNPYPFKILVETTPEPEETDYYETGSPEEAILAVPILMYFIEKDKKGGEWLIDTLLAHNRSLERDDDEAFWSLGENRDN